MRVIIAGGRKLEPYTDELDTIIRGSGFDVTEVVCGGAPGVDQAGAGWAHQFGTPLTVMPAIWREGPKAGPMRNRRMAEYADALILVWDGKSRGSASMKREAEKRGLPIHEVLVRE